MVEVTRTDGGDEDGVGEEELRETAPDVPARLVADAVVGVVVVGVGQIAGENDDVCVVSLHRAGVWRMRSDLTGVGV